MKVDVLAIMLTCLGSIALLGTSGLLLLASFEEIYVEPKAGISVALIAGFLGFYSWIAFIIDIKAA